MIQIEINFRQYTSQTIDFRQAKKQYEISKLKEELRKKNETARYLSCGRKGAWGRRTMADEKRDLVIEKLKSKIQFLEKY